MTYGSPLGWLNCRSWSETPLMLRINASCRLPSTGPNMFAIRPFGVSTDCTNIVKEIQVTMGENVCIVIYTHVHMSAWMHIPGTSSNEPFCGHYTLCADSELGVLWVVLCHQWSPNIAEAQHLWHVWLQRKLHDPTIQDLTTAAGACIAHECHLWSMGEKYGKEF